MKHRLSRREMLAKTAQFALGAAFGTSCASASRLKSPVKGVLVGNSDGAQAAQTIFAAGGNAVDAAIAAAFVVGVSSPDECGIGGFGGSIMIARGGKIHCIDFNSTAPAAARPDMYPLDEKGAVKGKINFRGWLAPGVPGTLAGLQMALDRFGTKSLGEVLQPAIALAGTMAPNSHFSYHALQETLFTLAKRNSVESFYRGDIAAEIADAFAKHGGMVTAKDLAAYQAREVIPYELDWNGVTLYTAPLCSGGLTTLEALSILKALKWEKMPSSLQSAQARLESLRLAWRDRAEYFGDPDFESVPIRRLLSPEYGKELAAQVKSAVNAQRPVPINAPRIQQTGTANLSAGDEQGNLAAVTLSHGNSYGAQVTVQSLGLVLGQGMARFDPEPGHPNSIAPGKRPLHNMCPTLVVRDGRPVVAIGAAGGLKIPNAIYDFVSRYVGQRKSFADAVDAPRLNSIGGLDLRVEKDCPENELNYFKGMGYKVTQTPGASVSAVRFDPATGLVEGRNHKGNPFETKK